MKAQILQDMLAECEHFAGHPPSAHLIANEIFRNEAGEIENLYEGELGPIEGVAIIRSRAGSSRSRHWHRTDWHLLHVLEGEMLYYERAIGSTETPDPVAYRKGQTAFTGPNVEHATHFPVDTILISISLRARGADKHEEDVVRVSFPLPTD